MVTRVNQPGGPASKSGCSRSGAGTIGGMVTSSPTGALIEARGLFKCYGDLMAVNDADFHVLPRDFLGFLGPNGAGKTTLMKMIYCLAEPTAGTLSVFDTDVLADPRSIKSRLGLSLI